MTERQADVVLIGASDDMRVASDLIGREGSEAAAFVIIRRSESLCKISQEALEPCVQGYGELGAAYWPLALARAWAQGNLSCSS